MAVITVENLAKHFGEVKALDGISFAVEQGEIFGFLVPNGAGKTTTIRCMMDFLRPTGGRITLLGKDAQSDSVELKHRIGYLSGSVRLYGAWTGEDHVRFLEETNGKTSKAQELASRLAFNPTRTVKELSSGNRQKLGIILALMFEPELVIMDEPTLALDPLLQNAVYELLHEATQRGATVFMSSHNLAEVERVCTRAAVIRAGRIVAVESIRALKEKRIHEVRVYFRSMSEEAKAALRQACGGTFKITNEYEDGLEIHVRGDVNPLLAALARQDIRSIDISHGSLEDVFLAFYEEKQP